MSAQSGGVIRLAVERMTYGADAIAHDADGKTVFVEGAVEGDVVEARVVRSEKSFSRAVTERVLEPSPKRVAPPCPYAGVCGGCPWSALAYDAQLEAKRASVVDALVRIGHMDQSRAQELVAPCEAPGKPWGYRNKIELAFARQGSRAIVGMHATAREGIGKPQVVKVDSCPLLSARHKRLVKAVSGALGYLAGSNRIQLDRVGIRASERTKDVEVALWTSPGDFPRSQAAKVLTDATKATSIVRVLTKGPTKARKVTGVEVLKGKGHWRERLGNNTMMLSAPSFFQVNTRGAQRLVELVLEGLSPTEDDEAMDLYCGAGTFTLPLAEQCGWVSAVESYGPAVRDLRRNLDTGGFGNVDPIGGDADREFPSGQANVIVVDPPRAGLAPDVVRKLSRQPASVTPVDLFPQTYHVESVVRLIRIRS